MFNKSILMITNGTDRSTAAVLQAVVASIGHIVLNRHSSSAPHTRTSHTHLAGACQVCMHRTTNNYCQPIINIKPPNSADFY